MGDLQEGGAARRGDLPSAGPAAVETAAAAVVVPGGLVGLPLREGLCPGESCLGDGPAADVEAGSTLACRSLLVGNSSWWDKCAASSWVCGGPSAGPGEVDFPGAAAALEGVLAERPLRRLAGGASLAPASQHSGSALASAVAVAGSGAVVGASAAADFRGRPRGRFAN